MYDNNFEKIDKKREQSEYDRANAEKWASFASEMGAESPNDTDKWDKFASEMADKDTAADIAANYQKYAEVGYGEALQDGKIDVTPAEAIGAGYVETHNPSQPDLETPISIQTNPDQPLGWGREQKNQAYMEAIETGIEVDDVDEGGIEERYTINRDLRNEIGNKMGDLDLDSEKVREKSIEGFANIVEALESSDRSDTAELDFYFDRFDYANHMEDFDRNVVRYIKKDSPAEKFLLEYLSKKPAWNEYLKKKAEELENKQKLEDESEKAA